jgi:hypothetical protein
VDKVSDEVLLLQEALRRSEAAREADRLALLELKARMEALTSRMDAKPPSPPPAPPRNQQQQQQQQQPRSLQPQGSLQQSPPTVQPTPVLQPTVVVNPIPPAQVPTSRDPAQALPLQPLTKSVLPPPAPNRPSALQHFANFRSSSNRGQVRSTSVTATTTTAQQQRLQGNVEPLKSKNALETGKRDDVYDKGGDFYSDRGSDKGGDFYSENGGDYQSDKGGDFYSDKGSDKGGDDWEDYGTLIEQDANDEFLSSAFEATDHHQRTGAFSGNAKLRGPTPSPKRLSKHQR